MCSSFVSFVFVFYHHQDFCITICNAFHVEVKAAREAHVKLHIQSPDASHAMGVFLSLFIIYPECMSLRPYARTQAHCD